MGVHMNKLAFGIAASVVALVAATGVQAADPILIDDVAISMATSNWDGPYAGIGVIAETAAAGTPAETIIGAQGILGYNLTSNGFLFGGEIYVSPFSSSTTGFGVVAGGQVRAGLLASDALLLYLAAGGEVTMGGGVFGTVGGGAEFWVADDLSLDLEYKFIIDTASTDRYHHVGLSANWHF